MNPDSDPLNRAAPLTKRRIGVLDCDVSKDFPPHVGFQFYGDRVQQWLSEGHTGVAWEWTQFRVNSDDAWQLPTLAQVETDYDAFVVPGARRSTSRY